MKRLISGTHEKIHYLAAFGLALFLRVMLLEAFPLREAEASWAYQAWDLAQGAGAMGYETAYLSVTRGLFTLFGSSNLLARFWPALVGSLIVWFPFAFRDVLGRRAARIMALGLALDPGLVVASRSVGGPVTALVFLLLAWGFLTRGKHYWAAGAAGMYLLSGNGWVLGLLILLVLLFVSQVLGMDEMGGSKPPRSPTSGWMVAVGITTGVVVVVSSYFLTDFQDITAWLGAIPAFFRGWTEPFPVPKGRLLLVLLLYQPLPLVFGLYAGVRGWLKKENPARIFSLWFVWALAVVLMYPGRQVWDLIWVVVPLWGLTGMALDDLVQGEKVNEISWILAGIYFVLAALVWLSFSGLSVGGGSQRALYLQWGMAVAAMGLVVLSVIIVAAEWSWQEAKQGSVLGMTVVLGLLMVAGLNRAAYHEADDPRQPWYPEPAAGQVSLLRETLQEVSVYQTGREDSIDILLLDDSASVKWALRDFHNLQVNLEQRGNFRANVVITGEERAGSMKADAYLGQDFVIRSFTDWEGAIPEDRLKWLISHEGPVDDYHLLLWVRHDAYPGGDVFKGNR